jgi:hypothetical protein
MATDSITNLIVKGIGFVDSGQCKCAFDNRTSSLHCGGGVCAKPAGFIDKHTLNTTSFLQHEVTYYSSGATVGWDPMYIDCLVWGDQFTQNQVEVFYYDEVNLKGININESPANLQSQILIETDFKANDKTRLMREATPKCRFCTSGNNPKCLTEEA